MSKNQKKINQGKVIEFKPRPRKYKKLKDVNYISPEKKELLRRRKAEQKKQIARSNTVKAVAVFLLVCAVIYFLAPVK